MNISKINIQVTSQIEELVECILFNVVEEFLSKDYPQCIISLGDVHVFYAINYVDVCWERVLELWTLL